MELMFTIAGGILIAMFLPGLIMLILAALFAMLRG